MTCTKPPAGWSCSRGLHDGPCAASPDDRYRKVSVLRGHAVRGRDQILETAGNWRFFDESLVPGEAIPDDRNRPRGTFTITVEFTPDAETKS